MFTIDVFPGDSDRKAYNKAFRARIRSCKLSDIPVDSSMKVISIKTSEYRLPALYLMIRENIRLCQVGSIKVAGLSPLSSVEDLCEEAGIVAVRGD